MLKIYNQIKFLKDKFDILSNQTLINGQNNIKQGKTILGVVGTYKNNNCNTDALQLINIVNNWSSVNKDLPTNCINCGAPLHNHKCEYCGTRY